MTSPATIPTESLIQALNAGAVDPRSLGAADRRRCVDHLTNQSFTSPDIAAVLRISARTVTRDRAALRRAGAMRPDRKLGDELMGEFERITFNAIARLARLARDETAPPTVRLRADREITLAYRRFVELAHRLHYLEDGQRRLRNQRESDPAEAERARQRMRQATRMLLGPAV